MVWYGVWGIVRNDSALMSYPGNYSVWRCDVNRAETIKVKLIHYKNK